ncbi:S8 family serine peptidase [Streptomyces sp. NPDC029004]|uniref:S8 family serine peptidase n=1 Tax=Streptomyces sp. NPDC029004 TaxID=3154490 RepID=UPI0033C1758C
MKRGLVITALSLTAIGLTVAPGLGVTSSDPPSPEKDGYIVVLKDGATSPRTFAQGAQDIDITSVYGAALNGFSARLAPDDVTRLRNDPAVAYVEREAQGRIAGQKTPNGLNRIRGLENKALKNGDGKDERVDADIAVLDTGVDAEHPDLNVVKSVNCSKVDKCTENSGDDDEGHGSNVAGIAAELDNGEGYTGVAAGARIWSVKILDEKGQGNTSEIVGGLDWVTAHADTIDVVNISAGYTGETRAITDAVNRAVAKGIVVVVSAGNDGKDVANLSPAKIPDAITVSNLADGDGKPGGKGEFSWCNKENKNKDDTLSNTSNFGKGVDIAAPGECIEAAGQDGGYSNWSGTSQAAPHVAGAAALIISGSEKPKNREGVMAVRDRLLKAGQDNWQDTSNDGVKEPLLDIHDSAVFKPAFSDAKDPQKPGKPGDPSESPEPTKPGPGEPGESGPPGQPGDAARITTSCDHVSTTCAFDASAIGGEGSTYAWDFGDGTPGTGAKVTHDYPDKPGTYAATVTVTSDNGKAVKATATVTCATYYSPVCFAH